MFTTIEWLLVTWENMSHESRPRFKISLNQVHNTKGYIDVFSNKNEMVLELTLSETTTGVREQHAPMVANLVTFVAITPYN